jgi:hypothetical protein
VLHYYNGDDDAPVNLGVGTGVPKNFYAIRPRDGRWGFRFFTHDAESTMVDGRDATATISAGATLPYFNPRWLSQQFAANAKYRLRFADRVQKHWFNGGAVDNPVALARWQSLRSQINVAILAESARWGDAARATPLTVADFNNANNAIETGFLATRRAVLISQLRTRNLFPSFDAPAFSQHGGIAPANYPLTITAPSGTTIFYTLDGSDPQLAGASTYTAPVVLNGVQVTVKSRAKLNSSGEWSALTEATFTLGAVAAAAGNLVVSEIHYNPAGTSDATEFVEILNRSTSRVDLTGVNFTGAMIFTFGNITMEPGARILVVEDSVAFAAAYGNGPVVGGQWSGALNNSGDTVTLRDKNNGIIDTVSYSQSAPWPTQADGDGYSLVRVNPAGPTTSGNWRTSTQPGGNPGAADSISFSGAPLADADHDGVPALLEYFFAMSDSAPSIAPIFGGRAPDGKATLTFVRLLAADDVALNVEVSTDLLTWTAAAQRTATTTNPNGTVTETWTADSAAATQFMRVRIVRP